MPFSLKSFFEKLKKVDKKKIIVASLVFSFAFLLIPLDSAFGFGIGSIGESIATAFTGVITVIVSGILTAFLALSSVWLIITESLFDWAYKANSGPLTHCPDENPGCFVDTSWAFIRDLANMVFILAIVIIAFATVLGFESYGMKKLLPTLVIMAVLINFSQFFVGVIVDISSVITDFFASTVEQTNLFAESFKTITSTATGNLHFFGEINKQIDIIFTFIAVLVMNCMMGLIFLIYAGIFILRIPMLWILTILSPLAFASRTLPFARGFNLIGWDSWIKQVTQWAFISAFALFYLYLVVMFSSEIFAIDSSTFKTSDEFGIQALIQDILPFGFIIIFMIIALQASMQTNAMFAGAAIGGARKISASVQNRATGAARAAKGAAKGAARAGQKEITPRMEQRLQTRKMAGWVDKQAENKAFLRHMTGGLRSYADRERQLVNEGKQAASTETPGRVAEMVSHNRYGDPRMNAGALFSDPKNVAAFKQQLIDKHGSQQGNEKFERKINEYATILEPHNQEAIKNAAMNDPGLLTSAAVRRASDPSGALGKMPDAEIVADYGTNGDIQRLQNGSLNMETFRQTAAVRHQISSNPGEISSISAGSIQNNKIVRKSVLQSARAGQLAQLASRDKKSLVALQKEIDSARPRILNPQNMVRYHAFLYERYPQLYTAIQSKKSRQQLIEAGFKFDPNWFPAANNN